MRLRIPTAVVAALLAAAATAERGHAQMLQPDAPRRGVPGARVLLDVPFVAQERLLCGAAAAEMALRYAGARGVYARDFRALVREDAGGIRTDDLAAAVRALGWSVRAGASDERGMELDLVEGRPVAVLLEDRPGRYHYVLVVGASSDSIVVHDPDRRPGVSLTRAEFAARWEAAGRWSLTLLAGPNGPGRSLGDGHDAPDARPAPQPLLEQASRLFREGRWEDARGAARAAAAADPTDARAWELLATSAYLSGDPRGALDAWGRARPPLVDRVWVAGLSRTRHPVVHDLVGVRAGEALRPDALDRARRRLSLLPAAAGTSLSYRALSGDLAVVEGVVREHGGAPSRADWTQAAFRAVAASELRVRSPSVTGGGESATFHARWAEARPAAGFTIAAPAQPALPGVLALSFSWEEERHAGEAGEGAVVESRTRASLALTDWASGWLRWRVAAGVDRWRSLGDAGTVEAEVEVSPPEQGAALTASVEAGLGKAAARYLRWSVEAGAEPLGRDATWRIGVRALAAGVDADAPRMVLPGADVGRAREGLLRAHRIEQEGVLSPHTIGSGLLNATLELERVIAATPFARLGVAAFADVARISRVPSSGAPAATGFLDAGLGLRLRTAAGALRLDAARGSDARGALSLTWQSTRFGPAR